MANLTHRMVQGDLRPSLVVTISDPNGPLPLEALGVEVWLNVRAQSALGALLFSRQVTSIGADAGDEKGQVTYEWQAGDTDTWGRFVFELEMREPGGSPLPWTAPADGSLLGVLEIRRQLG